MKTKARTLLGLICFGARRTGGLPRVRLMKYAFLLSRDAGARLPESGVYEFVPYKYGPFSFELYHDLAKLHEKGYVVPDGADGAVKIASGSEGQAREQIEALPWQVREALADLPAKYKDTSHDDLLREVYSRFPWYAVNSERPDLAPSPPPQKRQADLAVYTVGYEGQSADGFFDRLLRTGIRAIADVRRNPVSRKYGFSRSAMSSIAEKLDLRYVHMPALGIDSQRRRNLRTRHDHERLLAWYVADLPRRTVHVQAAGEFVSSQPTVLTCVESDPSLCHRTKLARALSERTGLPVLDIGPSDAEGAP